MAVWEESTWIWISCKAKQFLPTHPPQISPRSTIHGLDYMPSYVQYLHRSACLAKKPKLHLWDWITKCIASFADLCCKPLQFQLKTLTVKENESQQNTIIYVHSPFGTLTLSTNALILAFVIAQLPNLLWSRWYPMDLSSTSIFGEKVKGKRRVKIAKMG